jgi:hypothetical protein
MMKRATIVSLTLSLLALTILPAAAQAAFGLEKVEGSQRNLAGEPELRAGAHPNLVVGFTLNSEPSEKFPESGLLQPQGNVKSIEATLPEGLIGNPTATPTCSQSDLAVKVTEADCSPDAQVGIATINVEGFPNEAPIYNMEAPPGVAGQFAFNYTGSLVFINATVTAEGGYRLRSTVAGISQGLALVGTTVTFWGVPGSHAHDLERTPKGSYGPEGTVVESHAGERPFITNPTACTGAPLETRIRANSWAAPESFDELGYSTDPNGVPTVIGGCEGLPFEGQVRVAPTTTAAESPSGLDVDLTLAQNEFPEGVADSNLRDAVVSLPAGMAINPAFAGGLAGCSPDQIGLGTDSAPTCPAGSRIGTVSLQTPLLEDPLEGSVFVAQQGKNKFGSLFALYLVVDDPARGVLIKIPGKVEPDPTDGRLVARFPEAPQLPFSALHVSLFGGKRGPLVTPAACGTYQVGATLSPSSGGPAATTSDSFQVTTGPGGGACPSGKLGAGFEAGVEDPAAGQFSPLSLRFTRGEGSPVLSTLGATLPQGMLAKLAGVPYCSDAALAAIPSAEGSGAAQVAAPSCPAASRVGRVSVAAGAGPEPFWVKTGTAYLAGPYKGAPLSLALVTPAIAGPFDLGNVVVRAALRVDPQTTQVSAVSDPLPTILYGVPLDIREVAVDLDRQDFTVNPTSCAVGAIESTIVAVGGATATPGVPFATSSCRGLGFAPKLSVRLAGATGRTGNPALRAELTAPAGQANLARAQVLLPKAEFIDQSHVRNTCTRVQFAASACPAGSVLGTARAWSPLLAEPLEGPVYFRSNGGERKLPDLVADLHGQIDVVLVGFIDSVRKKGSENSRVRTTFAGIPDAPVSGFVLNLKGGKRGLLENSVDLCAGAQRAGLSFVGQNGRRASTSQALKVKGCGRGR